MGIGVFQIALSFALSAVYPQMSLETRATIGALVTIYPTSAVFAKRWHDRGKSGLWSLIVFIPIVGLWVFIELGFFPATRRPNFYGPDPRAESQPSRGKGAEMPVSESDKRSNRTLHLDGWQRLGVVLSCCWAAFILVSVAVSLNDGGGIVPMKVALALLVPIVAAWLAVYSTIAILRWVRKGFADRPD